MVISKQQFYAHVNKGDAFSPTMDKPLIPGPNTGDETGPSAITSGLIDQSEKQLRSVFHEPGWDMPDPEDFESSHAFEPPEKADYGHTVSHQEHR